MRALPLHLPEATNPFTHQPRAGWRSGNSSSRCHSLDASPCVHRKTPLEHFGTSRNGAIRRPDAHAKPRWYCPPTVGTHNSQLRFVSSADFRCPNCNSTDLKKVSLAYQEALFCTVAQTRFSAAAVGGHGPDLLVGRATTRGFHQSVLSKQLKPPVKWSYRKLILWWALVFVSIGWLVFYINTGPKNSSVVLSLPLTLFSGSSVVTFLLLLVLFWRHNRTTYKRRYSQWERSFLCHRCGTLTEQEQAFRKSRVRQR